MILALEVLRQECHELEATVISFQKGMKYRKGGGKA